MKRSFLLLLLFFTIFGLQAQDSARWQLSGVFSPHHGRLYGSNIFYGWHTEKRTEMWNAGISARIQYKLSPGFWLETGLGFNRFAYRTENYLFADEERRIYKVVKAKLGYDFIEAPVIARMILDKNSRLKPAISAGPVLQYYSRNILTTYNEDGSTWERTRIPWPARRTFSSPLKVNLMIGFSVTPRLNDRLNLLIEPNTFLSMFNTKGFGMDYFTGFGLNVGLGYKL